MHRQRFNMRVYVITFTGWTDRHGWSKHLRLNLAGRSKALSGDTRPVRVPVERIEQRTRLRDEQTPAAARLLVRGGPDTADKLRLHAERTARAWALDGQPLLGISVFAVLDMSLDDLLRRRFEYAMCWCNASDSNPY